MLVYITQPEFISHVVVLVCRIRACAFHFCAAERRVSMVVEGGFTGWILAGIDVDG